MHNLSLLKPRYDFILRGKNSCELEPHLSVQSIPYQNAVLWSIAKIILKEKQNNANI